MWRCPTRTTFSVFPSKCSTSPIPTQLPRRGAARILAASRATLARLAERSVQRRLPRADLAERVRDEGFTPSARDVGGLLDMLGDEATSKMAERAIARVGAPRPIPKLKRRLEGAGARLRPILIRLIGRLVSQGWREGIPVLLAALNDVDAKTRRNAAIALGRVQGRDIEGALLAAWEKDTRPEMRRSIAAALGKVGTERSLSPAPRGVRGAGS